MLLSDRADEDNACDACQSRTELFSIASRDGVTTINGQIDHPDQNVTRDIVLLVPGSGLFDRHYLLGESETDEDFIFDQLALDTLKLGLSVLRFDSRGISGNRRDPRLKEAGSTISRERLFFEHFVDSNIRQTVTPDTQVDDLFNLYCLCANTYNKIMLIGHSEGTISIGRMIAKYGPTIDNIIFISPALESPRSLFEWQAVDRMVQWIKEINPDSGTIAINDIRRRFGFSKLSSIYTISSVIPYRGAWTSDGLQAMLEKRRADFYSERAWTINNDDSLPWPGPSPTTQASFAWWKQWCLDDRPCILDLNEFSGNVHCVFDDYDTQTDYERQYLQFRTSKDHVAASLSFSVIPGVGHTLGLHGLLGPMTTASRDVIRSIIVNWRSSMLV